MDTKTRAEKIVTKFNSEGACLSNTDETYLQELITTQLDEAVREAEALAYVQGQIDGTKREEIKWVDRGFTAAKEKAAGIAKTLREEKQKCSPNNTQHDDRWCPECEAMEDAYGVIEGRIRTMEK